MAHPRDVAAAAADRVLAALDAEIVGLTSLYDEDGRLLDIVRDQREHKEAMRTGALLVRDELARTFAPAPE